MHAHTHGGLSRSQVPACPWVVAETEKQRKKFSLNTHISKKWSSCVLCQESWSQRDEFKTDSSTKTNQLSLRRLEGNLGSKQKFSFGKRLWRTQRPSLESNSTMKTEKGSLLKHGFLKMPTDGHVQRGNYRGKQHQDVSPHPTWSLGQSQLLAELKKHLKWRRGPDGTVQVQQ